MGEMAPGCVTQPGPTTAMCSAAKTRPFNYLVGAGEREWYREAERLGWARVAGDGPADLV
jgi:hypothetical protein